MPSRTWHFRFMKEKLITGSVFPVVSVKLWHVWMCRRCGTWRSDITSQDWSKTMTSSYDMFTVVRYLLQICWWHFCNCLCFSQWWSQLQFQHSRQHQHLHPPSLQHGQVSVSWNILSNAVNYGPAEMIFHVCFLYFYTTAYWCLLLVSW